MESPWLGRGFSRLRLLTGMTPARGGSIVLATSGSCVSGTGAGSCGRRIGISPDRRCESVTREIRMPILPAQPEKPRRSPLLWGCAGLAGLFVLLLLVAV